MRIAFLSGFTVVTLFQAVTVPPTLGLLHGDGASCSLVYIKSFVVYVILSSRGHISINCTSDRSLQDKKPHSKTAVVQEIFNANYISHTAILCLFLLSLLLQHHLSKTK